MLSTYQILIIHKVLPRHPKWLPFICETIRKLVQSRPTSRGRLAYTTSAAALLQAYPSTCPQLLFKDDSRANTDSKPFSYLFVNLLLIDIRSSFPSLLSKLNSPEYPAISQRLAAAFDVVSNFIGYLVKSLDDEDVGTAGSFSMPPDLLLKIRKDIAETMSLTIEYLRDRWDASTAGAPGLHASARAQTTSTSEGTRLTLTWGSMKETIAADQLVLAGLRTLAIWLREDENENLRSESAGLMDLLVELYRSNAEAGLDFRYPVLSALEGILTTEDGVDGFLGQEGWEMLSKDLDQISAITSSRAGREALDVHILTAESARGIEIIRVLLAIVDHESTSVPREHWLEIVELAGSMRRGPASQHPMVLEFQIAVLQLAAALLEMAPEGMRRRHVRSITASSGFLGQLQGDLGRLADVEARDELQESLDDITLALENLRS